MKRHYVVTGAARGIGLALARRLCADGATVTLLDVDAAALRTAVTAIDSPNASGAVLDVSDEDAVAGFFAELSQLDGLINNASILDASSFAELSMDRYRHVLQTNLESAVLCCRAALPLLERSDRARIVNVASTMGLFGTPNAVPYSTAKAGLINLTRCLAVDLAPRGVTVNAVAPGFVETRMSKLPDGASEYATGEFQEVFIKHRRLPIGRVGQPDDIAGPIRFLLSDDARYITGQVLVVDGGVTATY